MEQQFNSSFIPKKFLDGSSASSSSQFASRRSVMGPTYYFSVILIVAVTLAALGLFAYIKLTQQNITRLVDDLTQKTQDISVGEIDTFIRFDTRLLSASAVVKNHVAVSRVLNAIEAQAIKQIQYTAFEYGLDGSSPYVVLTGVSPNFEQVALQAEQFQDKNLLRNPVVKRLAYLDSSGEAVSFSIRAAVDPRLVQYDISANSSKKPAESIPSQPSTPQSEGQASSSDAVNLEVSP